MSRPVFAHTDPGTPPSAWAGMRAGLSAGALVGAHDHLAVVAAHPDDETLGAGGLIADAARSGARVTVVVVTDGEASHPTSPTHLPADLARRREQEVRDAVALLAPDAELTLLRMPDGTLDRDRQGLAAALAGVLETATVVAAPWRQDGHPDHEACGEVAAALCQDRGARLLEYPIWGWHWGQPRRSGPLRGGGWVARRTSETGQYAKNAALARHRSQHEPLSDQPGDEPVVTAGLIEHCSTDHEVFRESAPADLPAHYFDRLYAAAEDPWGIETGFYEQRKRELLLASLPRPRFRAAFEPGCARGRTTVELAGRCGEVTACDVSAAAVAATRDRTAQLDNVAVRQAAVPGEWPVGRFDLVVVSELGYYLAEPAVLAAKVRGSLTDDGVVVACHWQHAAPGYPSTAQQVHDALGRGLHHLAAHHEEDFLLDVWAAYPTSVATAEGVLR